MAYEVSFTKRAAREMRALERDDLKRLDKSIKALANDPRPPDCKKMEGYRDRWRIRVGRFRVIYSINDGRLQILVLEVGHRREVYRGM